MKPIVHWLKFEDKVSGLYHYTYSLHKATQKLGYESHICFVNSDCIDGFTYQFPSPVIGKIEASPWSVSKGAINFTHDSFPIFKLDNWITEIHGHPLYIIRDMDSLTSNMAKLGRCKLIFTRFPSHVQYWREVSNSPIHVIPPGVDLDHFKPEGDAVSFRRPVILWADTVRDMLKNPVPFLYAMKIVNRELPIHGMKLCGIPPEEISGYLYLCGRLGLDSTVEFPIEPMVQNMAELYRGVRDWEGVMYSDTNEEGSNSSWEAEACGLPVVHHKNSPEEIAAAIIEQANKHERPVKARDIKDTAKAMVEILERTF